MSYQFENFNISGSKIKLENFILPPNKNCLIHFPLRNTGDFLLRIIINFDQKAKKQLPIVHCYFIKDLSLTIQILVY